MTVRGLLLLSRFIVLRLFSDAGTLPAWEGSAELCADTISFLVPSWGDPISSSLRVLARLKEERKLFKRKTRRNSEQHLKIGP